MFIYTVCSYFLQSPTKNVEITRRKLIIQKSRGCTHLGFMSPLILYKTLDQEIYTHFALTYQQNKV